MLRTASTDLRMPRAPPKSRRHPASRHPPRPASLDSHSTQPTGSGAPPFVHSSFAGASLPSPFQPSRSAGVARLVAPVFAFHQKPGHQVELPPLSDHFAVLLFGAGRTNSQPASASRFASASSFRSGFPEGFACAARSAAVGGVASERSYGRRGASGASSAPPFRTNALAGRSGDGRKSIATGQWSLA